MPKKTKKKRVSYKELAQAFVLELENAKKRYPYVEDPFTVWKRNKP